MAALSTLSIFLVLTLYAWITPYDFTVCGALIFGVSMLGIGLGILCGVYPNRTTELIYIYFGLFAALLYLVYDT